MIHETIVLQTIAEKLSNKYDQGISKDLYTSIMRDVLMPVPSTIINRRNFVFTENHELSAGAVLSAHPNACMMSIRQCQHIEHIDIPKIYSDYPKFFIAGYRRLIQTDRFVASIIASIKSIHNFDCVMILTRNDDECDISVMRLKNYKSMMKLLNISNSGVDIRFMDYGSENIHLFELKGLMDVDPNDRWLVLLPNFEDFQDSTYDISEMACDKHLFVEYSFIPVNGSYNELLALTYEPIKNMDE